MLSVTVLAVGVVHAWTRRAHSSREQVATSFDVQTIAEAGASAPARLLDCRLTRRRFHTHPGFRPTGLCLARRSGSQLADEDILVTPRPDPRKNPGEQFGPMIISNTGKLLWYWPRPYKVHDLKVITYLGRPMLAFFQRRARAAGYYLLLDQHYQPVTRVRAAHGYATNLHELQVTPRGSAYVTADVTVHRPGIGKVTEYVVQEVDIASGKLLFQWRSLRHAGVRDSYEERPRDGSAWDYFHGNSVDPPTATDPVLIISSRNTSSLYGVDRRSGRTNWILGGKRDQFHLARHPSWRFCGQHDAHRLPNGDVMLFDNGGAYMHGRPNCPVHPARVLVFRIDPRHKHVQLVRSISSVPLSRSGSGFSSGYVGSAREESNGDTLVDWGPNRRITEIAPDGRLNLLMRLQYWSYRAVPAAWTGLPTGFPTIAASRRGALVHVYASWNGATQIRSWQLLAGDAPGALAPVGRPVPFADLETSMSLRAPAPYIAARALDAQGAVLGQSSAASVGGG